MKWFLQRLSEPSSHAGLSGVISGVVTCVSGNFVAGVAAILLGLAAFVTPEKAASG